MWPMFGNVGSDFNMQPAVTSRQVRVRDRTRVKWVASTRETLSRFDGMLFRENTFIALPPSFVYFMTTIHRRFLAVSTKIESLPPFLFFFFISFYSITNGRRFGILENALNSIDESDTLKST